MTTPKRLPTPAWPAVDLPTPTAPSVVVTGVFDGVHRGHAALLEAAAGLVPDAGVFAVTFDPPPTPVTGLLVPLERRLDLLAPAQTAVLAPRQWQGVPAAVYLSALAAKGTLAGLVMGQNHRFGQGGAGDAAFAADWCAHQGIAFAALPAVAHEGVGISSSRIRQAVADGAIVGANAMLGRAFCLWGRPEEGRHIAGANGVPTINLPLGEGLCVPHYGVYAARLSGVPAVVNLGVGPTFADGRAPRAEVHCLAAPPEGGEFCLELLDFLRPERPFPNPKALFGQVRRDIDTAKKTFGDMP